MAKEIFDDWNLGDELTEEEVKELEKRTRPVDDSLIFDDWNLGDDLEEKAQIPKIEKGQK